jgi:hypothetical protein
MNGVPWMVQQQAQGGLEMTNKHAKKLGKLGGEATKRKHGKVHFKRISKLGVIARQNSNAKKRKREDNRYRDLGGWKNRTNGKL